MARSFTFIACILAMTFLADKIFSYAFTRYIFNNTVSGQSGGTINYVIKHPHFDYLILGSSRAKNSIDPSLLDSLGTGYNLGINGSTPLNSLLVLDILLRNGVHPKTLLVQADLFEMGNVSHDDTVEQLKRVYPYDTELVRDYVRKMGIAEEFKYAFGIYRYNRKVLNIAFNFFKRNSVPSDNGFTALPSSPEKLDLTPLSEGYVYQPDSFDAGALMRIGDLAKANGIKLIVVFPPTFHNVGYNQKEQELLEKDMRKHGIEEIADFSDARAIPGLDKEEAWRDSFHLSGSGADVFTRFLNEFIKQKAF